MKPKKPTLLCSIGGLLLATASVSAATISVNFGANHGSLAAGTESAGAISVSSPNWNNASNASGTLTALKDDAGTTTSAKVTWTSANTWQSSATDAAGNDNGTLTKGYLDDSTPGYTATVSGAYFLSNVYLILATDLNADPAVNVTLGGYKVNGTTYGWNGTATVAGVNSWTTANSWSNQNTLTEGKNYIKVTNVAGTVAVQGTRPTGGRSALAGIQVENAYAGTLLHWDIDGATAGAGGATPSGNWDGTASNWSADSTGASATSTWAADNVAVFSAGSDATGSYTVTLAGTQNARGLWLQDGSITFSGGTISLTNERAIVVDAGAHAFDSVIAADGAAQLSVAPGSSVTLNAANTFTGNVSNLGTVVLANVNAVQNATLTLGAGSTTTLGVAGTNTYNLGGLAGSNSINIGANSLSVGAGGTATTYSGVISGTGSLTKVGSGTLTLSGINTYTGGTTVDGGTLRLTTSSGGIGTIRGTLSAASGTTIEIGGSDVLGYNGGATAVTTINLDNATLTQTMDRNETNAAVINMANGSTISATGGANAKFDMYGNLAAINATGDVTNTISSVINLRQNNTTFTVADGAAATDLLISGVISKGDEGNSAIIKNGAGTMVLTGNNKYTGNTTINGGVLQVTGTGYLYNAGYQGGATVVTVNTGGTLKLDSFAYGAAGSLGQLADYSVQRVINGGTIEVIGGAHSSGNNFNVGANGGTFRYNPTTTTDTLTLAGNGTSDISIGGALTIDTIGNVTVSEKITGTGSIAKTGSQTLTLSGNNAYAGGTVITTGVAKAGHANAFGTGSITVNGGKLDLNGFTIANATTINGGDLALGAGGTITVSGTATVSGSLTGSGTITGNVAANNVAVGNSPGLITVTGDLAASGTTTMEIWGTTAATGPSGDGFFDKLVVTGDLDVTGGTLDLQIGGTTYTATAGDTFDLFDFDTLTGTFATINATDISGSGLAWDYSNLYTTGTVGIVSVPEPSSFACVMGLAVLGAVCTRRRRRD